MANASQYEKLREGAEVWNRWRSEALFQIPDLTELDLRGAVLDSYDLSCCLFYRTNFSGASLKNTAFMGATLNETVFAHADLTGALLIGAAAAKADFAEATLQSARLGSAVISGGTLRNADLTNANLVNTFLKSVEMIGCQLGYPRMRNTVLADLDLTNVIGLDQVDHGGGSSIGLDTLIRSRGLSDTFLLGCGVLQHQLVSIRSLS